MAVVKSNSKPKRLVLLDAHAIIHRAYHALPDFASSDGTPTGALYGVVTMLIKIIGDFKPDYIVACYDLPEKTFRHEAYSAYKGTRAKTDDALIAQLIRSRDVFIAFDIPMYDCPGFEADDMLGTIVDQTAKDKDLEIIIASGDMDTLQLVSGTRVTVFTLKRGLTDTILYDEKGVKTRFGFAPEFLPDYKGLRGDTSDNIIGIKGIGEKTGMTLVSEFNTIENLYKTLKKNPEKVKAAGVTDRIVQLLIDGEDEALFSKTLATIRRDAPIKFTLTEKTFSETLSRTKVHELFRTLEFKSLDRRFDSVFGPTSLFPAAPEEIKPAAPVDQAKFERLQIAVWLLNSEKAEVDLEDIYTLAKTEDLDEAETIITKKIEDAGLSYVYESIELPIVQTVNDIEKFGIGVDREYLANLSKKYHTELDRLENEIHELAGKEFNINSPKQLGVILFDELKLAPETGTRMKKTSGGARSTRESELEKLRTAHPIIDAILKYRELQKLLSTYIDTLPLLIQSDGRIHAKFKQAGTTTGRFSSQDPNLQNIPIKTELGKNIRNAFVAGDRSILAAFDYSQIELRIAALLSQDDYFISVFEKGEDVHSAVAQKVFGVEKEEVTHEMRRRAKVINFGILYGMGVTALKDALGSTRAEAEAFHDAYFAQFPTIKDYLEGVLEKARQTGYTTTLFGRKRYFSQIKSKIPFMRASAERMAINAPIQGTATADVIKLAIKDVAEMLTKKKLTDQVHLVLQVHDELVFEISESIAEKVIPEIKKAMENVIESAFLVGRRSVPLSVEHKVGKNWGEMK